MDGNKPRPVYTLYTVDETNDIINEKLNLVINNFSKQ